MINWKAFVLTFLFPAVVLAQTAPPSGLPARPVIPVPQLSLEYIPPPLIAVPAGDDRIVALRQGEPAPFTGQLYDPATALRWAHFLQQARLRLSEDVLYERRQCNASLTYMGTQVELERTYGETIETDLRGRVLSLEQRNADLEKELRNPGFFKSPGFWFGTGVLATGLLIGAGILVGAQVH